MAAPLELLDVLQKLGLIELQRRVAEGLGAVVEFRLGPRGGQLAGVKAVVHALHLRLSGEAIDDRLDGLGLVFLVFELELHGLGVICG